MRQNEINLSNELKLTKEHLRIVQSQHAKSFDEISALKDKIKEIEEDNQNLKRELENFNLLQILSQSGILRTIRIEDGPLEKILVSLIQYQFGIVLESMDAPQPARVPRKKTIGS